jgi:hypothetical protein
MTFAQMLAVHGKKLGLSSSELAGKCGIPADLIAYIEDPKATEERLIKQCAAALGMKVAVFTGEEAPEATFDEKLADTVAAARFPRIRRFLLDPVQCVRPDKAITLFGQERVSLAERNLILYFSTTALYRFCETNISHFRFEEYLFKLHSTLFIHYQEDIGKLPIPEAEKQDLIDTARKNVFACDTMESIAIRIAEPFAEELEERLQEQRYAFAEDLEFPFKWDFDDELMKIRILGTNNTVKTEIKLLTVKEKPKEGSKT